MNPKIQNPNKLKETGKVSRALTEKKLLDQLLQDVLEGLEVDK